MAPPDEELLRAAAGVFAEAFGGIIRIEPDGGAPFWIDGRKAPPSVSAAAPSDVNDEGADCCTWFAARDTLLRIFEEERFLASSFVSGRLGILGDMSVMARLNLARPRG